jgi:hypothetical protein
MSLTYKDHFSASDLDILSTPPKYSQMNAGVYVSVEHGGIIHSEILSDSKKDEDRTFKDTLKNR